ncbi:unnamed protein product, partial [Didymodactylos carnosus]
VRSLEVFASELNFHCEEYASNKGKFPPIKRRQKRSLYVCTIEKANSLINSLIENKRLNDLGFVVVDELHMIGEGGTRGATLETALTKLRFVSPTTQIIGMSATLSNVDELKLFLGAEFYEEYFRPVKLEEYVKLNKNIYKVDRSAMDDENQLKEDRSISVEYTKEQLKSDPDQLVALVSETIPNDQCLVFCPTKKICENVAQLIISFMPSTLLNDNATQRQDLINNLFEMNDGFLCDVLKCTIPYGVAYHHSGLTNDERLLIEESFSNGILTCLTCTSTLAAGVNLPAKRVIIRAPYVADQFISVTQYKQMAGRAGRTGQSETGECIILARDKDCVQLKNVLFAPQFACDSNLMKDSGYGIKQLLL